MGAFTISSTVTYVGNIAEGLSEEGDALGENSLNDSKLEKLLSDIIWYTSAIKDAKERDES